MYGIKPKQKRVTEWLSTVKKEEQAGEQTKQQNTVSAIKSVNLGEGL